MSAIIVGQTFFRKSTGGWTEMLISVSWKWTARGGGGEEEEELYHAHFFHVIQYDSIVREEK
jgi:hypothetical protein